MSKLSAGAWLLQEILETPVSIGLIRWFLHPPDHVGLRTFAIRQGNVGAVKHDKVVLPISVALLFVLLLALIGWRTESVLAHSHWEDLVGSSRDQIASAQEAIDDANDALTAAHDQQGTGSDLSAQISKIEQQAKTVDSLVNDLQPVTSFIDIKEEDEQVSSGVPDPLGRSDNADEHYEILTPDNFRDEYSKYSGVSESLTIERKKLTSLTKALDEELGR
ncbi:hypothetical protein DD236_03080 [Ancrocorticia populi]|uniref:Uncharacterized protein n=1 Tax=Ancrocorticia populi TaxID=2175228 RepID=A0A2V1KER7_9ACTO|nr:hypothetical protein DD236_03080 [Ancrocorticia populi]